MDAGGGGCRGGGCRRRASGQWSDARAASGMGTLRGAGVATHEGSGARSGGWCSPCAGAAAATEEQLGAHGARRVGDVYSVIALQR